MNRLKLVTRFEEMKVGDLIIDLDCRCGRVHYAAVVGLNETEADERDPAAEALELAPNCCGIPGNRDSFTGINARIVGERRIYLVLGTNDMRIGDELEKLKKEAVGC